MIIYIYIYDITSNNVYKETFIIILKSNSLLLLGYPLLTVVFFLFLSLLLCYMLRFVSFPNKRRFIYQGTSLFTNVATNQRGCPKGKMFVIIHVGQYRKAVVIMAQILATHFTRKNAINS